MTIYYSNISEGNESNLQKCGPAEGAHAAADNDNQARTGMLNVQMAHVMRRRTCTETTASIPTGHVRCTL